MSPPLPPLQSTPTGRRRPRLVKKFSTQAPAKDSCDRPHLSGKNAIETLLVSSPPRPGTPCLTLSNPVRTVPSSTMVPPPPPGPSPASKRRPNVVKKTKADFDSSNSNPVPSPFMTTTTPQHNSPWEKNSSAYYPTPGASMKSDILDSNPSWVIDPVKKYADTVRTTTPMQAKRDLSRNDFPMPTSTPRHDLPINIAATVSRWPPTTMESSVASLGAGKQPAVASGSAHHRTKELTKVHHMHAEEDEVESVRPSSLVRGYQTLGVESFNLNSDVEGKVSRLKPQKMSKSGIASCLGSSRQVHPCESSQVTNVLAGSARAVLGGKRGRGVSMPAKSGHSAMELDLGICTSTKIRTDSTGANLDTFRKTSIKSSLLPSLARPEKTAGKIAWSVKMTHSSTPRGGHHSMF